MLYIEQFIYSNMNLYNWIKNYKFIRSIVRLFLSGSALYQYLEVQWSHKGHYKSKVISPQPWFFPKGVSLSPPPSLNQDMEQIFM